MATYLLFETSRPDYIFDVAEKELSKPYRLIHGPGWCGLRFFQGTTVPWTSTLTTNMDPTMVRSTSCVRWAPFIYMFSGPGPADVQLYLKGMEIPEGVREEMSCIQTMMDDWIRIDEDVFVEYIA